MCLFSDSKFDLHSSIRLSDRLLKYDLRRVIILTLPILFLFFNRVVPSIRIILYNFYFLPSNLILKYMSMFRPVFR
ncbi:hypothetical protein H5410_041982 [Solanum commersonii]|uniref:Uncharacterized protein n=1 Tax=Solanum commersonii TaxID=4109 RepID=A0A9J5XW70_SOLCO|nr:hypothetical protein H5410_041982 [Solanum commersonii]